MDNQELKELLYTIDILKLAADKGKEEIKGFAWYMIVWGFYGFINILISMVFGKLMWGPLSFVALFLTTIPIVGIWFSLIEWGALFTIVWALLQFTGIPYGIAVSIAVIGTGVCYYISYTTAMKRGKIKRNKHIITPKIGMFWGITMGGMIILMMLIFKFIPSPSGNLIYGIWGYILGVCMFISGIIAPGFYIIGLIGIFGVPVCFMFSMVLGMAMYGLLSLSMGIYGIILLNREKGA